MLKPLIYFLVALPMMGSLVTSAAAFSAGVESATLKTFAHSDGKHYFAVSLKADSVAPATRPHDVVFLFDTSATLAGDFRSDGLRVLRDALARLSPSDRVKLMAVDSHAIPLTDGFVTSNGPEMAAALAKLDRRVPLNSTDMQKALTAAADSFTAKAADSKHGRVVIYIGDGMSSANLLGTRQFEDLSKRLANERIPVSSCPVGSRINRQLLGALAGHTGGRIIEMGPQAGRKLAAAADAPVVWPPEYVEWPNGFDAYPKRTPPLRTDRDTVLIGTYTGKGPFHVAMTAAAPGRSYRLAWNLRPTRSSKANYYLPELVNRAKVDDGVSLPLIGSESLDAARRAIRVGVRSAVHLAREAFLSGNDADAERFLKEALQHDPGNPEALAIRRALAKKRGIDEPEEPIAPAPTRRTLPIDDAFPMDGPIWISGGDPPGKVARDYDLQRRVAEQIIRTKVQEAVNKARIQMRTDPEGAKQDLKILLETLRKSSGLKPEVRGLLMRVLQGSLRAANRRQIELEHRRQLRLRNLVQAREQMLITERLLQRQQRTKQLIERVNSLMDRGEYRLAEEGAAAAAGEVPENSSRISGRRRAS